jgi:hypothetical protein
MGFSEAGIQIFLFRLDGDFVLQAWEALSKKSYAPKRTN